MKHLWSSQTTSHKQKTMALNNGGSDSGVSKESVIPQMIIYKQLFLCSDLHMEHAFRMSCCATSLKRCDIFSCFFNVFCFSAAVSFQKIKSQSSTVGTRRTNNLVQQGFVFLATTASCSRVLMCQ